MKSFGEGLSANATLVVNTNRTPFEPTRELIIRKMAEEFPETTVMVRALGAPRMSVDDAVEGGQINIDLIYELNYRAFDSSVTTLSAVIRNVSDRFDNIEEAICDYRRRANQVHIPTFETLLHIMPVSEKIAGQVRYHYLTYHGLRASPVHA